jgi:hypothetical protein
VNIVIKLQAPKKKYGNVLSGPANVKFSKPTQFLGISYIRIDPAYYDEEVTVRTWYHVIVGSNLGRNNEVFR